MLDRKKVKAFPLNTRDHALVMDEIKICPKHNPMPCGKFEDEQIKNGTGFGKNFVAPQIKNKQEGIYLQYLIQIFH